MPDPLVAYEDDPVGDTVYHPCAAYCQGWDARDEGHALDRNPYADGTREAHWWSMGWAEADDDGDRHYQDPEPPDDFGDDLYGDEYIVRCKSCGGSGKV